ncbi:sulfotransferase [Candidatus Sumerlaeota bacterium]|nr:sulfotransferase [Candidatus Sumerlaeota bacterium]
MSIAKSPSIGIIVLGPYRSGTSVVSQVLTALGVDFGEAEKMFGGDARNPGGYFERADINEANTRFIQSAGYTLGDPGDPDELIGRGDAEILRALDLSWLARSRMWGIKDPRLCATLAGWIEFRLIDPNSIRIINVTREIDPIVQSVCKFEEVFDYCGRSRAGAREMTERYLRLAQWQTARSGAPVCELKYETLIADPKGTIEALASFIGARDEKKIARAAAAVGKDKSLIKHYAVSLPKRVLTRGPTKIVRKLRGK